MNRICTACLCVLSLATMSACQSGTYGPMASGRDRTFSVPNHPNDPNRAQAAAANECSRHMLQARPIRQEGGRTVYECVSEQADKP